MENSAEITQLLNEWRRGDTVSEEILLPLVYDELRRIAAWHVSRERSDHTLQPTAVVHEVYLKLRNYREVEWTNRRQFFAVAARIMRHVLVDYARMNSTLKRKGKKVPLEDPAVSRLVLSQVDPDQVLQIDRALANLAADEPRLAQIIEMRFFVGLSIEETAEVLNLSSRTVKRDWNVARAMLHSHIAGGEPPAAT